MAKMFLVSWNLFLFLTRCIGISSSHEYFQDGVSFFDMEKYLISAENFRKSAQSADTGNSVPFGCADSRLELIYRFLVIQLSIYQWLSSMKRLPYGEIFLLFLWVRTDSILCRFAGNLSGALALYKNPAYPDLWTAEMYFEWSQLFYDSRQYMQAANLIQKAAALDPSLSEHEIAKGKEFENRGTLDELVAAYHRARYWDPKTSTSIIHEESVIVPVLRKAGVILVVLQSLRLLLTAEGCAAALDTARTLKNEEALRQDQARGLVLCSLQILYTHISTPSRHFRHRHFHTVPLIALMTCAAALASVLLSCGAPEDRRRAKSLLLLALRRGTSGPKSHFMSHPASPHWAAEPGGAPGV
jgi:tetratricopeptide (TPR) repeat protein